MLVYILLGVAILVLIIAWILWMRATPRGFDAASPRKAGQVSSASSDTIGVATEARVRAGGSDQIKSIEEYIDKEK